MTRLSDAHLARLEASCWGIEDLEEWTTTTGLDLAQRAVARLLDLEDDTTRTIDVWQINFAAEKGHDGIFTTGHTAATHRVKFRHSRTVHSLEIRAIVCTKEFHDEFVVLVSAERFGKNGKTRNPSVTLGYMANGELVELETAPNTRSVETLRALGKNEAADRLEQEMANRLERSKAARARN